MVSFSRTVEIKEITRPPEFNSVTRKIEEKVLDEDFTMNNPVHTPVGKPITLPVPKQGVILGFISERKRKKMKSKWRKNKWKDKPLSNRIPKVYNKGRMLRIPRIILEHLSPWRGCKFKLKVALHMTDGIHTQDGLDYG